MKDKEYVKAFKVLTDRLRNITKDKKARLSIKFDNALRPVILYITRTYDNGSHYCHFSNGNGCFQYGNKKSLNSLDITYDMSEYYSIGHMMKGCKKNVFAKLWLSNAIGNALHILISERKLLDANDTVESLCVQYDMTHI